MLTMNRNRLLAMACALLSGGLTIQHAAAQTADQKGDWEYCYFQTQTQRPGGEWVIYFSDVFFQPLGHGDPQKEFGEYIRGKYAVDPHDTEWCGGPGRATEATIREDKAKKVKYLHYSGQIVETGWRLP